MQKYLLQQPKTLETLAIARVADWVTLQAEDLLSPVAKLQDRYPTKAEQLLSRKIKSIRNFVQDHMLHVYFNKLASELMNKIPKLLKKRNLLHSRQITSENVREHIYVCDPIDAYNIVSRMIEITFTQNLTFLLIADPESEVDFPVLEYNIWDIFKSSFCSKSHLLSGLVRLQIQSCSEENDIIQLLKELHNLKYLSLNIATYNVLKCVVDNCKLIEQLEVDYREEVTDESIDILTRLRNLKHVNLNATTVTKIGMMILLLCCHNIESIQVSGRVIENTLEDFSFDAEYADKQFKLTYFSGTQETTAEQLQLVVKMCPRLQTVELSANGTSRDYLLPLHGLTDLRYLTLFGFDFYGNGIIDLLEARGNIIIYLDLILVDDMNSNALTCIFRTCPNLQSLTFRSCTFERENLHAKLGDVRTAPLQHLKKITITTSVLKPTDDQLVYLFSNCPNVEFVDILVSEADLFTDEIMFQVVDGKNWTHLKELKLYKTGLSKYVIDLIVQNCAGQPEVIIYDAV